MNKVANRILTIIATAATAALITYLFDAGRGKRRRAILRDKVYSKLNTVRTAADRMAEDVYNRSAGVFAGVRSHVFHHNVADNVLCQRVRARLGRLVSHPSAIVVTADNGVVTLRGPILKREVGRVLIAVRAVPGVKSLVNQLSPRDHPGQVSSLQGEPRRHMRDQSKPDHWAPATRLLVGLGGGLLAYYGLQRQPAGNPLLAAVGLVMVARAVISEGLPKAPLRNGRRNHGLPELKPPLEASQVPPTLKRITSPTTPTVKH